MNHCLSYEHAFTCGGELLGQKALNLAQLKEKGFDIAPGFCLSSQAYLSFCDRHRVTEFISAELHRKSMKNIRWEELWDTALRIRHYMQSFDLPDELKQSLIESITEQGLSFPLVVRSSSPEEDNPAASFAGLFDSYLNCQNHQDVFQAVKQVWCSLWSDRSLMYRKEMSLAPDNSCMAVLIQQQLLSDVAGICFTHNPNDMSDDRLTLEVSRDSCDSIVSGQASIIKACIERGAAAVVSDDLSQYFDRQQLQDLIQQAVQVEHDLGCPADIEWLRQQDKLIILQARPITRFQDPDPKRPWYLSLTPREQKLDALALEVESDLIPELRQLIETYQGQELQSLTSTELADAIEHRAENFKKWQEIYINKFIPFAHGVRQFGYYYNDRLKPQQPYEFIQLLEQCPRQAVQRRQALSSLASEIKESHKLLNFLKRWKGNKSLIQDLRLAFGDGSFIQNLERFTQRYLDMTYAGQRTIERDDVTVKLLLEYAEHSDISSSVSRNMNDLEHAFLETVPAGEKSHAKHLLHIARLSWQLRDDDNLLMGALESQCLKSLECGSARLLQSGLLAEKVCLTPKDSKSICRSLRESVPCEIEKSHDQQQSKAQSRQQGLPRQLRGQAASPGLVTGKACVIKNCDDFLRFEAGNIIVCDTVDPVMTHIFPLASGIIERRGGMLIHSTIIARELGLPCVNGVADVEQWIEDGDLITVDGNLGIVIFEQTGIGR